MQRRTILLAAFGASASLMPLTAGAQWAVLDAGNLIQNTSTAINSVRSYLEQVRSVITQIQQYQHMVQQARQLGQAVANQSLQEILDIPEVRDLRQILAAGQDLTRSIRDVEGSFRRRIDEARQVRISWRQYVEIERRRISRSETAAVKRVQAEQETMKRLEKDYDFIRREGARIGGGESMQQALQVMNVQMNRMLQQNAEVMRAMALSQGSQAAESQMQEAERRAQALQKGEEEEEKRLRLESRRARDKAAIDSF